MPITVLVGEYKYRRIAQAPIEKGIVLIERVSQSTAEQPSANEIYHATYVPFFLQASSNSGIRQAVKGIKDTKLQLGQHALCPVQLYQGKDAYSYGKGDEIVVSKVSLTTSILLEFLQRNSIQPTQ
jgi:hypothetical protein